MRSLRRDLETAIATAAAARLGGSAIWRPSHQAPGGVAYEGLDGRNVAAVFGVVLDATTFPPGQRTRPGAG